VAWNVLDFIIVVLGVFEICIAALLGRADPAQTDFATLFRMFRLMRILRIFKIVRFLKELYLLAYGLALAANAIIWVTVLMAFVLYVCAIVLVRTVGSTDSEFLRSSFRTIPVSMLTLFNFMAQPDLEPYGEAILEYPAFGIFLIIYTIFGSFGLIALLTGVIGESMFEKNQLKIQEDRLDAEKRRKMLWEVCAEMMENVAEIEDGKADRRDVECLVPEIQALFDSENIRYATHEFECMLNAMDKNNDGLLNKDDLCSSVMQIADGVRPGLLMEILTETAACRSQLAQLKQDVSKCLQRFATEGGNNIKVSAAARSVSFEAERNGNRHAAIAELQTLLVQLRGDVQQIERAVQMVTEFQSPAVAPCGVQTPGIRENVKKGLGLHEEGALFGSASLGSSTTGLEESSLSMRAILLELRHDVQILSQRPMQATCSHQNVFRDALRADYAARMEAEEAKFEAKLEGVAQSLAERLAHKMESFPMHGRGAGHTAEEKLGTTARAKAGFSVQQTRDESVA